jgi:hypothetical protein
MKTVPYFVVGLLLLSGIAIVSVGEEAGVYQRQISKTFFEPQVIEHRDNIKLECEGANSRFFSQGKPILPIYTETLILPFGATIDNIECQAYDIKSMELSYDIVPGPQPVILDTRVKTPLKPQMDESVYNSEELYPDNWFSYEVSVGLDDNMDHKTFLTINVFPIRYIGASDTINYAKTIDLTLDYIAPKTDPFPAASVYDLVIICPEKFKGILEGLKSHKNSKGVLTTIVTIDEIYDDFTGYDKPERIKKFIHNALETWDMKYVLIVGGLKSKLSANPRENRNEGTKGWHVPIRYANIVYNGDEPGYLSDLYYADIYKIGGDFDNWDSNGNHIYGENADKFDHRPDVSVGRLPCRSKKEVRILVDKIIEYEDGPCDPSWFNEILMVSGDGFLDQEAWGIQWNTNGLPTGEYTIHGQAHDINGDPGPEDTVTVTVDHSQASSIRFNHDDHLTTGLQYPFDPVAEIVSVSDGDILGNTNYQKIPKDSEAYCNDFFGWGNIRYMNGILVINGKCYDPEPYGYETDIHIWVTDSGGSTVFEEWGQDFWTFYEGEWTTGNQELNGRGGAPYYMPSKFNTEYIWTSNGKWVDQPDVIQAMSKGHSFVFFSGHGSPAVWGNHFPGIPGNRQNGSSDGLKILNLYRGLRIKFPLFPMSAIKNNWKNPIVVVGGCHNSMFNVSLIPTILDPYNRKMTHSYGMPTWECWSWVLTSLNKNGAIATLGNTGYGYGIIGEWCTVGGVDNWITTEIFVQYASGKDILGQAHQSALSNYMNNFPMSGENSLGNRKTVSQFVLLGDPSLKIGGYP